MCRNSAYARGPISRPMMNRPSTDDASSALTAQTNPIAVISGAEVVAGTAPPGVEAGADEGPADQRPEDGVGGLVVAQEVAGESQRQRDQPGDEAHDSEPDQREAKRPQAISSSIVGPESWSLATNPRAPLRVISSAESDQSRLEVSTTAGGAATVGEPLGDLEAIEVGQLDVEQDHVRVAGGGSRRARSGRRLPRRRPRTRRPRAAPGRGSGIPGGRRRLGRWWPRRDCRAAGGRFPYG